MAVGMTACAEEPPPEPYRQQAEIQEQEPRSLKDQWDNGTSVHQAIPPTHKAAYRVPEISPARSRAEAPRPEPRARPAPRAQGTAPDRPGPDLAISAPAPVPPPRPKVLTERDLAEDARLCGGNDCLAALRAMIDDPKQSWMMRAPTPAEFANGTRLFAYRALRPRLDCGRLRFAGAELEWAADTFSRDLDGIDAEHRLRVSALAAEVRAELEAEIARRC